MCLVKSGKPAQQLLLLSNSLFTIKPHHCQKVSDIPLQNIFAVKMVCPISYKYLAITTAKTLYENKNNW